MVGFLVWAYAHCSQQLVICLGGEGTLMPALPIRAEGAFKARPAGGSAPECRTLSVT